MPFVFILLVIVLQTLIFFTHWFLYLTLVTFFGITSPKIIVTLKFALGILSLMFIPASILAFSSHNVLVGIFYTFAAFWLGTLLYLFLAACFNRLGYAMAQSFSFFLSQKIMAGILFGLALAISFYGVINASNVRVSHLAVRLPNLPTQWQDKKALWISDLHLGVVRNYDFAKLVASRIQELHPDIVFIGGDLYDGVSVDLDKAISPFANLHVPKGTFFVTGNHEEFDGREKFLEAIRRAGIRILNNELINIDGLQIIGVDYHDSSNEENFKAILRHVGLNRNQASILLKHAPTGIPIAKEMGISLQLSGHAHAGQIFPVGLISNLVFKGYAYGLKHEGSFTIYTSSGTGTWGPPMRVGTTPEILLLRFELSIAKYANVLYNRM
jgi:predicted MPP superfamily phosphohydrolase